MRKSETFIFGGRIELSGVRNSPQIGAYASVWTLITGPQVWRPAPHGGGEKGVGAGGGAVPSAQVRTPAVRTP
eukprot:324741-Prorocentrum_minimum.AAC.2